MTERTKLMQLLAKRFPSCWFKEGELFSPDESGTIWTGESSSIDDMPLLNWWTLSKKYYAGVHIKLFKFINRHGWYSQRYDDGTLFIYPKN